MNKQFWVSFHDSFEVEVPRCCGLGRGEARPKSPTRRRIRLQNRWRRPSAIWFACVRLRLRLHRPPPPPLRRSQAWKPRALPTPPRRSPPPSVPLAPLPRSRSSLPRKEVTTHLSTTPSLSVCQARSQFIPLASVTRYACSDVWIREIRDSASCSVLLRQICERLVVDVMVSREQCWATIRPVVMEIHIFTGIDFTHLRPALASRHCRCASTDVLHDYYMVV
jgi:hypothetical protein